MRFRLSVRFDDGETVVETYDGDGLHRTLARLQASFLYPGLTIRVEAI